MVPRVEVIGGPRPVHLRPEVGHREAPVDGRPSAVDEGAEHGGDDGVEVEERQWGPDHVVGRALPADADLAGQRLVVVVAEHAALGRSGRAPRVDEGGQVRGPHADGGGRLLGGQQVGPRVVGHPGDGPTLVAEDHDVLQGLDLLGDALDPLGQVRFHDHDPGPAVGQLVAQVLAFVGRVDRYGHGAGGHRAPPGVHGLDRVLDEGGHPVAGPNAELAVGVGKAVGDRRHLRGGGGVPAHVEVGGVGVGRQAAGRAARGRCAPPRRSRPSWALAYQPGVTMDDARPAPPGNRRGRRRSRWSRASGPCGSAPSPRHGPRPRRRRGPRRCRRCSRTASRTRRP